MEDEDYIYDHVLVRRVSEFVKNHGRLADSGIMWVNAGEFLCALGLGIKDDSPMFNYELPLVRPDEELTIL